MAKTGHQEDEVMRTTCTVLQLARVRFLHVPNEGLLPPAQAAIRKGLGMVPGAADLICFTPTATGRPGLALEVKRGGRNITAPLAKWLGDMKAAGWSGRLRPRPGGGEELLWLRAPATWAHAGKDPACYLKPPGAPMPTGAQLAFLHGQAADCGWEGFVAWGVDGCRDVVSRCYGVG